MPVMSSVESAFCRSAPWRSFARHRVLPWALAGRPLSGDVLEIGAGSGAMAAGVNSAFPDARLTLTDIDEAMVSTARSRLAGRRGVVVEQADVAALPFNDRAFDVVTSYLMLHHVVVWKAALTEAARVLRPGGIFLGYDLTDTLVAGLIHRLDRSPFQMLSAAELGAGLAEAGFIAITVEASVRGHLVRFSAEKPHS
jgi:ubiquinone/menaquinone biosynthesis C-methylase UbiE